MPRRILVVKRDQAERTKLIKYIERTLRPGQPDLIIKGCASMASALEYLRTEKVSAIITGEHFNDGTGTALYDAIRGIPAHKQAMVVLYTGAKQALEAVTRWRHRDNRVTFVHSTQGAGRVLDQISYLFGPNTVPNVG